MKSIMRIAAMLLLLPILSACTAHKRNERTLPETVDTYYSYQRELADWLTPEETYGYDSDSDSSDGIIQIGWQEAFGGNLFFTLSRISTKAHKSNLLTYVDLASGEKHYACPDPQCTHSEEEGCPYLNLFALTPKTDTTFFALRHDLYKETAVLRCGIYEVDLAGHTITEVYDSQTICAEENIDWDHIDNCFLYEDMLYFTDTFRFAEWIDGEKQTTGKRTWLLGMDINTHAVTVLNDDFGENISRFFRNGDHVFYTDSAVNTLYGMDLSTGETVPLVQYPAGYTLYQKYYDTHTDELYVLVSYMDLHDSGERVNEAEQYRCTLYSVDADFRCREVPMPTTLLLDFQLTNEYIYYCTYDPVNYKTKQYPGDAIDVRGNKLYRVKRSDTTSPEVAFDGQGQLFFDGYYVTGDYLYMELHDLRVSGGVREFYMTGSTMRIDMRNHTIKWFNLE